MFGTQDLQLVHAIQADLRRNAANERRAKQHQAMEHHQKSDARRVLGLRFRLSLA
jgi:hypothetical protein